MFGLSEPLFGNSWPFTLTNRLNCKFGGKFAPLYGSGVSQLSLDLPLDIQTPPDQVFGPQNDT